MADTVLTIILPGMFGLGAAGLAALSAVSFGKTRRWRSEGVTVEGEVVDLVKRDLPPRENLEERDERVQKYSPVLSYRSSDGTSRRATSSAAEPEGAYKVGQKVTVRYLSTEPETADLEKMAVSNVPGIAFAILAFLFGAVALVVFFAAQGG